MSISGMWNWPARGSSIRTRRPGSTTRLPSLGASTTCPGRRRSPLSATETGSDTTPSSQRARPSTKPSAMCWTTSTGTDRSVGSAPRMAASAGGPPVEAPMQMSGVRRPPRPAEDAAAPFGATGAACGAGADAGGRGRGRADGDAGGLGGEAALAQAAARVGDDADPAGHAEVAGQGAGVDRGPEALGAGRDAVDGAGGQRLGGGLGGRAGEHDRGRAVGHDAFDDVEAAGRERQVEQDRVRGARADEIDRLVDGLREPEHLDARGLQQGAEAGQPHVGARDDDRGDRSGRLHRRARVLQRRRHSRPPGHDPRTAGVRGRTLLVGSLRHDPGGP